MMRFTIPEQVHCSTLPDKLVIVSGKDIALNHCAISHQHSCLFCSQLLVNIKNTLTDTPIILLAITDDQTIGLIDAETIDASLLKSIDINWQPLRESFSLLVANECMLASRAIQLNYWQQDHRYCGYCGSQTLAAKNDRAMVCLSCERRYYPRFSPCVIGAIIDDQKILLAQSAHHASDMYSLIAGFIEVGENAEQALVREVHEEVGVAIKNIRYVCSQNWPFPSQLMLGFLADYDSGQLVIDNNEIIAADWFDLDDLPVIPPDFTIAGKLIRHIEKQHLGENVCT